MVTRKTESTLAALKRSVARRARQLDEADDDATGKLLAGMDKKIGELRSELWSVGCEQLLKAVAGVELKEPGFDEAALRFRWPANSRGRVIEEIARSAGPPGTTRYVLAIGQSATVGVQHLVTSDFEFLKVGDDDVTGAEMRMRLGPARSVAANLPTLIVNGRGKCVGIDDEDEFYARLERMTGRSMGTLKERAARRHLYAKAWLAWLGSALGLDVTAVRSEGTLQVNHILPRGQTFAANATWSCGSVAGLPRQRWVRMDTEMCGPDACNALRKAVSALNPRVPANKQLPPRFATSLHLEILCDLDTGRPTYAARIAEARLLDEGEPICAYEAQQWTFDWTDE